MSGNRKYPWGNHAPSRRRATLWEKQVALRNSCADHVNAILRNNEEMTALCRQQREVESFCRASFSPADYTREFLGVPCVGSVSRSGIAELIRSASLEWEEAGLLVVAPASVVAGLVTLAARKDPPSPPGPETIRGPQEANDDFVWEIQAGIRIHPLLWMLRCDLRLRWKPQPVDGINDLCLPMMQKLNRHALKVKRSGPFGVYGFRKWFDLKLPLTLEQAEGSCGFTPAGLAALVDICTDEDWAVAVNWMSKRSAEEWPGERFDDPVELGRWMRAVTPPIWRDLEPVKTIS